MKPKFKFNTNQLKPGINNLVSIHGIAPILGNLPNVDSPYEQKLNFGIRELPQLLVKG